LLVLDGDVVMSVGQCTTPIEGEFHSLVQLGALVASEGPPSGRPKDAVHLYNATEGAEAVRLMLDVMRPG
jgi:hypothetical protein